MTWVECRLAGPWRRCNPGRGKVGQPREVRLRLPGVVDATSRVVSRGGACSSGDADSSSRNAGASKRVNRNSRRTSSGFGFLNLEFAIWERARVHDGGEARVDTTGKGAAQIHEFTISGKSRIQGWEALEFRDEVEGRWLSFDQDDGTRWQGSSCRGLCQNSE